MAGKNSSHLIVQLVLCSLRIKFALFLSTSSPSFQFDKYLNDTSVLTISFGCTLQVGFTNHTTGSDLRQSHYIM